MAIASCPPQLVAPNLPSQNIDKHGNMKRSLQFSLKFGVNFSNCKFAKDYK
jgi:hypothetical protein